MVASATLNIKRADVLNTLPLAPCFRFPPYKESEMTPASDEYPSQMSKALRSHRSRRNSRSHPISSQVTISSAGIRASQYSDPHLHLASDEYTGDHGYGSQSGSIWDWVAAVDCTQQSLPDRSAPLSSDALQVPRDVDMDSDIYSPAVFTSSSNAHLTAATMAAFRSSNSSPVLGLDISPPTRASSASDRGTRGCLNDWQYMMDAAHSFFTTSPIPSPSKHTTSALPMDASMLDESLYNPFFGQWTKAKDGWKEEDLEGEDMISAMDYGYVVDAYPRSATSSSRHSDIDIRPVALPAILDHQDFSSLMLQSFTLAHTDTSLEEGNKDFQPYDATTDAEIDDDQIAILALPPHLHDYDFMDDQWSPPALRSSSSASSLDPFHLELFSPASEQADPAAVWDEHRVPEESSDSPGYYSSSPFVGWSSASDTEMKPVLLTLGHMPIVTPYAEIPLHHPQPIRLIPPIPVNLLDEIPDSAC